MVAELQRRSLRESFEPAFLRGPTPDKMALPPGPASNRQRFQRKFFALVVRTLNKACGVEGGHERDSILSELQTHLSARIESKVIAYFLADGSIATGKPFGNRFYYELAAEGFGQSPELFAQWNLDATVSILRSNHSFHAIFAMLFHQWIFQPGMTDVKGLNVLLSGAEQLFRRDLDSFDSQTSFVYRPVYQMMRKVLANHFMWSESLKAVLMQLWDLWARYSFFYEKQAQYIVYNHRHFILQQLLEEAKDKGKVLVLNQAQYENVKLNGAFVQCVIKQLLAVKSGRVFRRYMNFIGIVFGGMRLPQHTAIQLHSELYSRSKPGNPYYMPDECRRAAQNAMATVFPNGHLTRRLVSLLFRLSQPYYTLRHLLIMCWLVVLKFFATTCWCCCKSQAKQKAKKR